MRLARLPACLSLDRPSPSNRTMLSATPGPWRPAVGCRQRRDVCDVVAHAGKYRPEATATAEASRGHIKAKSSAKKVQVIGAPPSVDGATSTVDPLHQWGVSAAVMYHVALFSMMILAPKHLARNVVKSLWMFAPLGLLYGFLLAASWTPDTLSVMMPGNLEDAFSHGFNPQFFPKLDSITILFSRTLTALSAVVHLASINLFLGRHVFMDGLESNIPTFHSLVLATAFGPLGLLSHILTKALMSFGAREPGTQAATP